MRRSAAPTQLASRKRGRATPSRKTRPAATSRNSQSLFVPRGVGRTSVGFPKQLRVTHRWVEVNTLTTTAGTLSQVQFSCNGMFAVNTPSAAHQPMYFDQLAGIYNHFTVVRSKCTVNIYATTGASFVASLHIDDDTTLTTPSNIYALCEQNSSSYAHIPPLTAGGTVTLSKSWSAIEAFGPNPLANDNLQGSSAANPAEQQHYTLSIQDASGSVAVGRIVTTVVYEAIWDELKNINSS